MTTRKALCNIKGLSEAKVEKIKEAAGKMLVKWDFHHVVLGINWFLNKMKKIDICMLLIHVR